MDDFGSSPVEDCDTSPVKDSDSSHVEDCDTSPVKDSDSSPVEDCDTSPVKDSDASPVAAVEDCHVSRDTTNDTDLVEQFLNKMVEMVQSANDYFKLGEKWELLKFFAYAHPVVGAFLLILTVMSLVPFVCFCVFALTTSIVVVVSGLFVQAMFLSFGMTILLGVIAFLCIVSLALTCFAAFVYYGFTLAQQLIKNIHLISAERNNSASNIYKRRAD